MLPATIVRLFMFWGVRLFTLPAILPARIVRLFMLPATLVKSKDRKS